MSSKVSYLMKVLLRIYSLIINRDSSVTFSYTLLSEAPFSNRHSLRIIWSKPQELLAQSPLPHLEHASSTRVYAFSMTSLSTPDKKQSEAFIATAALFLIFGSSPREDKAALRLSPAWKELWTEFSDLRKEEADKIDRDSLRVIRDMIREKRSQDLEEGILMTSAFRNRGNVKSPEKSEDRGVDKPQRFISAEGYQRIWAEKSATPQYQAMLVSCSE